THTESSNFISPSDLNVLGRKLYAAFERKAGKIDIIYKGITADLFETHLSFHQQINDEGREYWMVFSGIVNNDELPQHQPLKRGYSLIEIMAWCYFNKIINKITILAIFSTHSDLTEKELHLLVEQMDRLFPDNLLENSSTFDMLKPAEIRSVATFINVGIDPFSEQTRHGTHITSNRTDALKYGGKKENLTLSIDQVITTSWNEVLTFNFYGIEGLLECVQDYMKWAPPSSGRQPPPVNAFSFSSYRGTSIARRIELLFSEIIGTFYSGKYPEGSRYILGIEREYYILNNQKGSLNYEKSGDITGLYKYLSRPLPDYQQTIFDSEILSDNILPQLYLYNKQGDVQFFFETKEDKVDIYVLDERGSLFTRTQSFYDVSGLIKHYQEYFESVKERMTFYSQTNAGFKDLVFYRIERKADGNREIIPQASHTYIRPLSFISLQVLVDRIENTLSFTLYCHDREFTNLQYGDNLYKETATHIISLRGSGEVYPIYITDLDLSAVLINGRNQTIQTTQYLYYKKIIEERLLKELKTIS
ncbi:MAG: class I adenylate cyclase, partial [Gammaproteobacteria bacterium]|nr:class I adenylate cyclase [Gammaproteobacteria bacterium]